MCQRCVEAGLEQARKAAEEAMPAMDAGHTVMSIAGRTFVRPAMVLVACHDGAMSAFYLRDSDGSIPNIEMLAAALRMQADRLEQNGLAPPQTPP